MDDSPVARLVNALLLAAATKGARKLRVYRAGDRCLVEALIGDQLIEELAPPLELHGPIVRRLGVLASLPVHRRDEVAEGTITLAVGERALVFEVRVMGHGATLEAWLRPRAPAP